MQYNININQKALLEIALETNSKLRLEHGAVLDHFLKIKATEAFQTKIINEKSFIWISYKNVLRDLPLLYVESTRTISRYFQDLVDAKILEKFLDVENSKTFFAAGENFQKLFFNNKNNNGNVSEKSQKKFKVGCTEDNTPLLPEIHPPVTRNTPPCIIATEYNNTNNNTNYINSISLKEDLKKKILDFLKNQIFGINKKMRFENLTDEEIVTSLATIFQSYNHIKDFTVFNMLADIANKKTKEQKILEKINKQKNNIQKKYKYRQNAGCNADISHETSEDEAF